MTTYNWDLIERLLHEVQNERRSQLCSSGLCGRSTRRRKRQKASRSKNLDHLKAVAGEYEKLLLERGYIEPRPEEKRAATANFVLTPRGSRLLSLIDSSIPGKLIIPRQVLDEQEDALDEFTFDDFGFQGADCLTGLY